jgi:hypothetical protein
MSVLVVLITGCGELSAPISILDEGFPEGWFGTLGDSITGLICIVC